MISVYLGLNGIRVLQLVGLLLSDRDHGEDQRVARVLD